GIFSLVKGVAKLAGKTLAKEGGKFGLELAMCKIAKQC
uniref:Esculentin-2Rb n=1 Tax=Pelophylax ridibundus TaxID=8406 RepID=ES2RB_PELRI|nr:RecName: Full=Esculentin-2Rb [Pelophylax ridibundus]